LSAVHFERGVGDGDRLGWSGLGYLLTHTVGARVGGGSGPRESLKLHLSMPTHPSSHC